MHLSEPKREVWLDWTRLIACFMVMFVHSTEPFYLGGDGALILTRTDAFWAACCDSLVRACVPIFVVMSSYLQFPVHYATGEFFRRRLVRILIPFAVWSVVYACAWGEPVQNFRDLLVNFNAAAGHLWYVYMLLGLYLLMPLLSPWIERASRREVRIYLAIWLFTTLIPLIRDWAGGMPVVIDGASGVPRQAMWPVWGEASWNSYGLFYYVSGFVGYLLLGAYFRKFVGELSWPKTLAVALPLYAAGFAVTCGGFLRRVLQSCDGSFPAVGGIEYAVWWETTWGYDTIGVALMSVAWILLLRKCTHSGAIYRRVVQPVARASYGMYLMHLLLLVPICGWFRGWLGLGDAGKLGCWTTPAEILLSAAVSFVCVAVVSIGLQRIPKVGKYLVG